MQHGRGAKYCCRLFLILATVANFTLMSILVTHTSTGWLRNVVPGFDQGVDPTRDALPWTPLSGFLHGEGAFAKGNFVAGVHWTECGHVDNAAAGQVPFLCISSDPRNIAFNVDPTTLEGQTGFIATSVWPHESIMGSFSPLFQKFKHIGDVAIERAGRSELAPVRIYRGEGLIIDRSFGPSTTATYVLPMLPLTKIEQISGTVDELAAPLEVVAFANGVRIGAANVIDGKFQITTDMKAALPRKTVTLELKSPDENPVFAKSVEVDIGFHK